MKLLVDPVLLLRKRGGLEERKQVYSGCSTFRGKQLRVSDQSQGWQSNQATKSQTHEEGFVKVKIMRLLVWGSQLLRHKGGSLNRDHHQAGFPTTLWQGFNRGYTTPPHIIIRIDHNL